MARKYTLKRHLVFCVKYRKKLLAKSSISQTIKNSILDAQTNEFAIQVMEVDKDHIHLLVDYSPNISVCQIVRMLKQVTTSDVWSSHYIELKILLEKIFWPSGYFVCSTGNASTETIAKYITEQG